HLPIYIFRRIERRYALARSRVATTRLNIQQSISSPGARGMEDSEGGSNGGGSGDIAHSSEKRRPGRPKGSRNKSKTPSASSLEPPRPRGRPRGSGPKQLAAAAAARLAASRAATRSSTPSLDQESASQPESSELHLPKRPVGRPRLHPAPPTTTVNVGRTNTVPGMPAVIRSRPPDAVDNNNPNNIHLIFLNAPRFAVPSSTSAPAPSSSQTALSPPLHEGPNETREGSTSTNPSHPQPICADRRPTVEEIEDEEDEEDGYDDYLNDGIGEDPGGDDDEDDGDSDGLSGGQESSSADPKPQRTPRPYPTWVTSRFTSHVAASAQRGADGLPPLYRDHKSFWFLAEDPFFSTQNVEDLKPESLFHPRFFLWDPMALGQVPCPREGCRSNLNRHATIKRPRRCVDFDDTFYMIGYRYRCPKCVHSKSGKNTVTYNSWDAAILCKIPRALANAFPAVLSHRSAISERVFMFMRSCFQSGMGAKQFSDALRVRHLENYDKLQVSYLSTIARARSDNIWLGANRKYKHFLPFEDMSSDGFHGYIPSSQLLRDLFDRFIEHHGPDFNQAISLLTGWLCAIDHSFKLAKHIAKVNGEQIFIALLTVTNELGEIRVCNLVATKSHTQFELALDRMRESLKRYGHDQPAIFYTDNMADKAFLERCFPSLCEDVVAVEKYSQLECLELPRRENVYVMHAHDEINEAMRAILHELPEDSLSAELVLFVDSEWNVETSTQGYVTGRGSTAILQLGFRDKIYILQIGRMLSGGRMPPALKQLFTNPRILKVGRAVHADLKYLQEACASTEPFVGAVDLARLAKDRLVISTAKVGLDDLCARVLGKRLNKNVAERVSTLWETETLSEAQITYAALDVHACRCLYDVLSQISPPVPLPKTAGIGTEVLLFSEDRTRVVAHGTISAVSGKYQERITITASQCIVRVTEVVVPGALAKLGTKSVSLEELGDTPFEVIWRRNHLHLHSPIPMPVPLSSLQLTSHPTPHTSEKGKQTTLVSDDPESVPGTSLGQVLRDLESGSSDSAALPSQPFNSISYAVDLESQKQGEVILDAEIQWNEWRTEIRSRVLKDPFHIFNMFYLSVQHSLRVEFARTLRDALFIPDPCDKARIVEWGRRQNVPRTWDDLLFRNAAWLWKRCKRIIPPPEELYALVSEVFRVFGPLKDATTGLPLFNSAAWAVAKNILELIRKGFVSDPPSIALYSQRGVDKKTGLPLFRCFRGTNFTEGGVHTHLRSRMPTSGASIPHVNATLKDFILCHNKRVGTMNSTGKPFRGHFFIWLTNEIQEYESALEDVMQARQESSICHVNGNFYLPTNEVSGVLPIPADIRVKAGMAPFDPVVNTKGQLHRHLASLQGTRKAVLPIHNEPEKLLFKTFMSGQQSFGNFTSDAQVNASVRAWNIHADTDKDIHYKLPEQLKAYYNGAWKTNSNIKQTKALTSDSRRPLLAKIRDPKRLQNVPAVPETPMRLPSVPAGLLTLDSSAPVTSHSLGPARFMQTGLDSATIADSGAAGITFAAGSSQSSAAPEQTHLSEPNRPEHELRNSHMRVLAKRKIDATLAATTPAPKPKRAKRSCRKCGQQAGDCRGAKEVRLCSRPCRDCGKVDCRGRNPKSPNVDCARAKWDDG
ncbi:unnamed protein product, partial [Mycena citricolor]